MIDINALNSKLVGTGMVFQWTKEYMVKVLTTGKNPIVTDPLLINALQKIDRQDFVPELLRKQAYADVELDIGYGEKLTKPTAIAQMLALLKPTYGGKYLDIGTGTGYAAIILGFVAGDQGHVYTIERVQWLWEMARDNSKKYQDVVKNVDYLYRDGIEGLLAKAPFDGIHITFALKEIPQNLLTQLKPNGGRLVVPTEDMNLKVIERKGLEEYEEEIVPGFLFDGYKEGIA